MSTSPCPRCSRVYPDDQLIPVGSQRICLECESEIEETKKMRASVYRSILSLPVIAITGLTVLCIPVAGVFVGLLLSLAAIVAGIQGIRLGMSIRQDPQEYGVGDTEPILLIVFGVLTSVWGLVWTLFDGLACVAVILALLQ